tara:strand:- start:1141 stop:1845 length:705 start_codon:yes stop_codon:yes gene_type:complete
MRVSIHQPNYIPWIGYFEKIFLSDTFVFFDNVQMPMNKSLVSRNKILFQSKPMWLTIPTEKGGIKPIKEVKISDTKWKKKHLNTLYHAYGKKKYFNDIFKNIQPIIEKKNIYLVDLNMDLIKVFLKILNVNEVKIIRASELNLQTKGANSIFEILKKLEAKTYITGTGAGSTKYINAEDYNKININLMYNQPNIQNYYPKDKTVNQVLSILDLLFNYGAEQVNKKLSEASTLSL